MNLKYEERLIGEYKCDITNTTNSKLEHYVFTSQYLQIFCMSVIVKVSEKLFLIK